MLRKQRVSQSPSTELPASINQVRGKPVKAFRRLAFMILAATVILIITLTYVSPSPKSVQKIVPPRTGRLDYQVALSRNLSQLYHEQSKSMASQVTSTHKDIARQQQLRQRFPTRVYSQPSIIGWQHLQQKNHKKYRATQAEQIPHPTFVVAQGTVIKAVLETAINSDFSGSLRAMVTAPVYSYVGARLLIPAASRLVGEYLSARWQGQVRAMIIWRRIILPSGVSVNIRSPGTDRLGAMGYPADVINRHFWQRFSQAILFSIIGAGVSTVGVNDQQAYNSAAQYRTQLGQSLQTTAQATWQQHHRLGPTLGIFQGAKLSVMVAKDISFFHVLSQAR